MAKHWYMHSVLSTLFCSQEHEEFEKKRWLGLQVQFVAPKQVKLTPCPWPGLYVTNKLSLANKPENKNPSQKQKMDICIAQTMPNAQIWAIYFWKSKFIKSIRWATFASLTNFFFLEVKNDRDTLNG